MLILNYTNIKLVNQYLLEAFFHWTSQKGADSPLLSYSCECTQYIIKCVTINSLLTVAYNVQTAESSKVHPALTGFTVRNSSTCSTPWKAVSLMLNWKLFYIRHVLFLSFLNSLKCPGFALFSCCFHTFWWKWLKSSLTNSVHVLYISDQSCARRRDLQRTVQSNANVHCQ